MVIPLHPGPARYGVWLPESAKACRSVDLGKASLVHARIEITHRHARAMSYFAGTASAIVYSAEMMISAAEKLVREAELIVSVLEKSIFAAEIIVPITDITATWMPIIESGPEMIVCEPSITEMHSKILAFVPEITICNAETIDSGTQIIAFGTQIIIS